MRIYFDGCSWTRGGELTIAERKASRFSRLVADHFGAEEKNLSLSGGSNDRIVRNMLVNKKIEEYDLAVIEMTFPARTEYYSGITWKKDDVISGWLPVNPKYNFSHMVSQLKKNQLEQEVLDTKGVWEKAHSKFLSHKKFWSDYYRTVTTHEFFETKEKIQKQTIMNHCQVKGVPLVICTINPWTKETFDIQMNTKELPIMPNGHPNIEGHRILADQIISIAERRL